MQMHQVYSDPHLRYPSHEAHRTFSAERATVKSPTSTTQTVPTEDGTIQHHIGYQPSKYYPNSKLPPRYEQVHRGHEENLAIL